MKRLFDPVAWDDYLYWHEADPKVFRKINEIIRDCVRSPFKGLGKPEALRSELSGWWSRRIDDEHRMIYRVSGTGKSQTLEIIQLRFHYRK